MDWSCGCNVAQEGNTNMLYKSASYRKVGTTSASLLILVLCLVPFSSAQDRDRNTDRDRNRDNGAVTTLERGTVIPVRVNEAIDVERKDNRVYTGVVDADVRGDDGRLAIPRDSEVE